MSAIVAFACGVVFAVGLAIAGMTQPAKVIGFLDITGRWDPSLLVVMVGAIGVFLPVHRLARRRKHPLLSSAFHAPTGGAIDAPLLAGAAIFGVGWGASGYCPGPAIASLAAGGTSLAVFAGALIAGMLLVRLARPVS